MGTHALIWIGVLVVYAIGGYVTDRFNAEAFLGIFFGIGFGIFLSNAVGMLIALLAEEQERKLYQWVWVRALWWAHAPWLVIGPLTLVGTMLGGVFRLLEPDLGYSIFDALLLPIFFGWVVFCLLVAVWFFSRRYGRSCEMVGIGNSNVVVTLHSVWALIIMLGSGIIGVMGGTMGVLFIEWVLTGDYDSFII